MMPSNQMEKVKKCSRNMHQLTNCVTYETNKDFIYKTSMATAGLISQSAVVIQSSVWNILLTAPPDQISHWLLMSKVSLQSEGAMAETMYGTPATIEVELVRKCSLDNCMGCRDLVLQRLCYAASQCQIARCIGTMVHLRRPLCSIGRHLASVAQNMISFIEGAWLIIAETMSSVLALSGGIEAPKTIAWPDTAFFGFMCSAKDITASSVSILTSSINGIVQSAAETPLAQNSQSKVSNKALMVFSMTLTATTNFLNQVALFPLYSLFATQKIFVCSANSVMAAIGSDQMSITIGDPTIKNLSSKSTKCMSQYFTEMSKSSDNTATFSNGAIAKLTEAYAAIKMDFLIHPIDATLTYISGVISGIQDVTAVLDRNR